MSPHTPKFSLLSHEITGHVQCSCCQLVFKSNPDGNEQEGEWHLDEEEEIFPVIFEDVWSHHWECRSTGDGTLNIGSKVQPATLRKRKTDFG